MQTDDLHPDVVRRCPLLGALLAKPPAGVVPDLPNLREPAKRVRWQVGLMLRRCRHGARMSEITRETGMRNGEVNAALGKMRAAGEVNVTQDEDGKYRYHWRRNA